MEHQSKSPLTVAQAADELGVSQRIVRDLINQYELRAFDASLKPGVGTARWRVTREALEAFKAKRSNQPPADRPKRVLRRTVPQHV